MVMTTGLETATSMVVVLEMVAVTKLAISCIDIDIHDMDDDINLTGR